MEQKVINYFSRVWSKEAVLKCTWTAFCHSSVSFWPHFLPLFPQLIQPSHTDVLAFFFFNHAKFTPTSFMITILAAPIAWNILSSFVWMSSFITHSAVFTCHLLRKPSLKTLPIKAHLLFSFHSYPCCTYILTAY